MASRLTRRTFLKGSAASAAAAFAAPRILSARSPNEKLSVACIGAGGRGGSHVGAARRENLVALVDVDRSRLAKAARGSSKIQTFTDYRKMFDKMAKQIDAVSVATPDHNHACASMMAIQRGKHVYCEKPLTWSVAEARALTEAARKYEVTTQMGNQGHCGGGYRTLCEWIWDGAIGPIRETHSWTNRPIWPQGLKSRPASGPVPSNLDWDCWIGPAPYRDFHGGLHPFAWRGWYAFGAGALGDMACHIMDGAFWSLRLGYPDSVELVDSSEICKETFPKWAHICWEFPARPKAPGVKVDMPPVKVHWWDGRKRPPIAAELERKFKRRFDGGGSTLYIGEKGIMYTGCYGGGVGIVDPDQHKAYQRPTASLPKPRGNSFGDFYASAKLGKPAYSNFDYAGPFTETVVMGNLSIRAGKGRKVLWDGKNMKVTNFKDLNEHVGREYRKGWSL
jgi:predicted dehydrogenase